MTDLLHEGDKVALLVDTVRDFYDALAAMYEAKMTFFGPHREYFIQLLKEMKYVLI